MDRFQRAFNRLDQFIAQHIQEANIVGVAVALTDRKKLLHTATYGFADLAAHKPVTHETLFEIGSITKSFTAVALLQLYDAGRLDLHAPVTRYLPWFCIRSRYAPITVHHLLTHTAGLPRGGEFWPPSRYEAIRLRECETGFPPGSRYYYSNIGYQILGFLLEEVTGQGYGEVLRKRILEPLGMSLTDPVITHDTRKRLAVGYEDLYDDRPRHPSHPLMPAPWFEYGAADGSLASTPDDMAIFLRMLLNGGQGPQGRLLSKESFALMTQRTDTFSGCGLGVAELDGHTVIGHSGGMPGYRAAMLGDLDEGLGAIVLMNRHRPANAMKIAEFALRLLQAALHDRELPPLPQADESFRVENAAEYAGTYRTSDKALTLVAAGERLVLRYHSEEILLERGGPDTFYANHPDFALFPLRFGRDKSQKVVEVFHGPGWYTNERYVGPTHFEHPKEWKAYTGHYRRYQMSISNFRVVLRKGQLWLISARGGDEAMLVPLEDALFRVGQEDYSPERIRFDTIINGQALCANFSGCDYYRALTP